MTEKEKVRVIQYYEGDGGCAFWRMLWQGFHLNTCQEIRVIQSDFISKNIMEYALATVVHIQKKGSMNELKFFQKLSQLKERLRFRLIYEVDDCLLLEGVPKFNHARKALEHLKDNWKIREVMELCDEVTVTTHALRDYYLEHTKQKNITVIPNYLPRFWIGHVYDEELLRRNYRKNRARPRILFAGSSNHFEHEPMKVEDIVDDFSHVREAVLSSMGEFEWVFVGAMPMYLIPYKDKGYMQYYSWKTMDAYPDFLSKLNINMCIAPLNENRFNECKSDLKFLEASALGLPIACQDMCTYAIAPIRFKTGEEMLTKIRETLRTEDAFIEASREGRRLIETRWLENKENIGKYAELYTYPYGDYRRRLLS